MRGFLPVDARTLRPGQPLAEDLYNRQAVLVAARGSVIDGPQYLAWLTGQGLFRRAQGTEPLPATPLERLFALAREYHRAVADARAPDLAALPLLAVELRQLVDAHPELCTGMAPRLESLGPARRHSFNAAIVASQLARLLDLDDAACRAVVCAALTMNLASHDLQDNLIHGAPPDPDQARQLRDHPAAGAEALLDAGVDDPRWLAAVVQHHENLDGSGYPRGLKGAAILPEARVLRAADVWCALAAHRHNRIGRYPKHALRLLFQRERARLDDAVILALRHLMGCYPPGTLVRLANRETALVTRWFPHRPRPDFVVSLLRPSGDALRWPERRHTGQPFHAIRDYTYLPERHAALDWARIWAVA